MAGFPLVPKVNGDTDDDASIHLYNNVGRAKPLKDSSVDDKIKFLWNQPVSVNKSIKQSYSSYIRQKLQPHQLQEDDDDEYNEYKSKKLNLHADSDYDSDETRNDSDSFDLPSNHLFRQFKDYKENVLPKAKSSSTNNRSSSNAENPTEDDNISQSNSANKAIDSPVTPDSRSYFLRLSLVTLVTFLITLAVLFGQNLGPAINDFLIANNFKTINTKISKIESKLNDFNHLKSSLQSDFNDYRENQTLENQRFKQQLIHKFDILNDDLKSFPDFQHMKSQLNKISSIDVDYLKNIDSNLQDLQSKVDHFDNLKSQILHDLFEQLPETIPVYIRDNKIHIIPEFHKYLFNFIDNYYKSSNLTRFKPELIENSNYKLINKTSFENIINRKLQENNERIYEKLNNVIDNLNINTNNLTITNTSTNSIFLNELLDIFNKGSIKINYASFGLGARILGFLTNLDLTGKVNRKSLLTKMFTGWFEYFNSSENWKYNANNVLLDKPWQCQSNECSIGIRLSESIIITDIFIKSENLDLVRLFIKPKNYNRVDGLKQYITNFKIDETKLNPSKYIKKFFKIKTVHNNDLSSKFMHLKLPLSLINLRISCKDIYLEVTSKDEHVVMNSIKVYGISEFDSYKYNEDFDNMLSTIQNGEISQAIQGDTHGFEDVLLGDDFLL